MMDRSDVELSNVIVDGNRPALGWLAGDALIQAGGSASGQVIRQVRAMETRSWSILHLFEGARPQCSNAIVENNELGPAGHPDGSWADGISLACTHSVVRNNTIVDATDGGIVIFGAPGSLVEGNTIRAESRTLLGGINMVDFHPYQGDYTNTVVRHNLIDAAGAVIRVGMGMGHRVWVCLDPEQGPADLTLFGAVVKGNTLQGDHMQYGYAVDGVRDWTVTWNLDLAVHLGAPTVDCRGVVASPPAGFQYHAARAEGTFQTQFAEANLELALWAITDPSPED
jgi:parallel beta-helix repeat protein